MAINVDFLNYVLQGPSDFLQIFFQGPSKEFFSRTIMAVNLDFLRFLFKDHHDYEPGFFEEFLAINVDFLNDVSQGPS